MNLTGKIALITGASGGIGEGIAKALAHKGVKVGLAARRTERLKMVFQEIKQFGGEGLVLEMDVTNKESVSQGVASLKKIFGSIDILVNNAGLMPASELFILPTDQEW